MLDSAPTYHEELARLRHAGVLAEARKRNLAAAAARPTPTLGGRVQTALDDARDAAAKLVRARRHAPTRPATGH